MTLAGRRRHQLKSGDVMTLSDDVRWRTVTSLTRRRERTSASVDETIKMADWVVSTCHSQTCCTLYSHLPHHLTTASNSNTTSSFTSKVCDWCWNYYYCAYVCMYVYISAKYLHLCRIINSGYIFFCCGIGSVAQFLWLSRHTARYRRHVCFRKLAILSLCLYICPPITLGLCVKIGVLWINVLFIQLIVW